MVPLPLHPAGCQPRHLPYYTCYTKLAILHLLYYTCYTTLTTLHLLYYTPQAASLDTYTDSNTRERRPYEADGIIAATARLLVQRDVLWARHSHAWVIQSPTWPGEWKQITPFLGWQDYM